jgi:regulator of sigma E protease
MPLAPGAIALLLLVLIALHESGHLLAARWCGVGVARVVIGLGRPLLRRRLGGVDVGLTPWLIGGYVQLVHRGDVGPLPPGTCTFEDASWRKRSLILLAGPAASCLGAWFAFLVASALPVGRVMAPVALDQIPEQLEPLIGASAGQWAGDTVIAIEGVAVHSWDEAMWRLAVGTTAAPDDFLRVTLAKAGEVRLATLAGDTQARRRLAATLIPRLPPVVGQRAPYGLAAEAGLLTGDSILSIDGTPTPSWGTVRRALMQTTPPRAITVHRDTGHVALTVPKAASGRPWGMEAVVPLAPRRLPLREILATGTAHTRDAWGAPWLTLRRLFRSSTSDREGLATGARAGTLIDGAVVAAISEAADEGPTLTRLWFIVLGYLSMHVAWFNLFMPIPVCDGGQWVLVTWERVTGRQVSLAMQHRLAFASFLLLGVTLTLAFWLAWRP